MKSIYEIKPSPRLTVRGAVWLSGGPSSSPIGWGVRRTGGTRSAPAVCRVVALIVLFLNLFFVVGPTVFAAAPSAPPTINSQPSDQTVAVGGTASFSVNYSSYYKPVYFQWSFNGVDLTGATNQSLTLTNVQPADQGSYKVLVSNARGSTPSTAAYLTVQSLIAPSIPGPPQSQTVLAGATVTFGVTAEGSRPLRYQWRYNDAELAGETNATLILSNVQVQQAGRYVVVVTNGGGTIASPPAILAVNLPPPSQLAILSPAGSWPFQMQVTATVGSTVVIETSSDCKSWSSVFTNAATSGSVVYTDASSPTVRQRFYRGLVR